MTDDVCTWRHAHDPEVGDYWISDCGLTWAFSFGGGPAENEWEYCPKCGKKLIEEEG